MKILILSTHDLVGGAAKAAYRLHLSLLDLGVNSVMLVQFKTSDDPTVLSVDSSRNKIASRIRRYIEKLPSTFFSDDEKYLFSLSWLSNKRTVRMISKLNPDIVHLHWFNSGMLSISDLPKIKFPIVWTLHDMWAFTLGLHVDPSFDIYLDARPKVELNIARRLLLKWKKRNYLKIENISIVGLSKWITTCSENSFLLSGFRHMTLPNPIDTCLFTPVNRFHAREFFDLNPEDKVILFGAWNAETDMNKGFHLLKEALISIPSTYTVVLFGTIPEDCSKDFKQNVIFAGHISSEDVLVKLYSSADIMVVPSLYENLSNSIMESLSCGTPVAAFDVGGNSDLIDHKINGYLAKPYSSADLAQGIRWILRDQNCTAMSVKAREKSLNVFDSKFVANKYLGLYKSIIGRRS